MLLELTQQTVAISDSQMRVWSRSDGHARGWTRMVSEGGGWSMMVSQGNGLWWTVNGVASGGLLNGQSRGWSSYGGQSRGLSMS